MKDVTAHVTYVDLMTCLHVELLPMTIEQKLRDQGIKIKDSESLTAMVTAEDLKDRIEPPYEYWNDVESGDLVVVQRQED